MDPAAAGAGSWDTELAWHVLTVLLRMGRPAAAAELAAVASSSPAGAMTPQHVERLCHAPGSPLRFSGGTVTVSGTAVVAFLRFLGWDVPAVPRARLRPSDLRSWCAEIPIRYERKRKAPDADRFGVKRRLLMGADADLVEPEQQQPIVPSCSSVAAGEVHLEVMQDRLPLVSNIAKIGTPCLQPKLNQSLGVSNDNLLGNMASTLTWKELSVRPFSDIPSICAEKSENIHAVVNEISRIGELEGALSYYNCRVEDSEDLEKKPSPLPMIVEVPLVGDTKIWLDEDLNLFHTRPCSPSLNCDTQLVDSIVRTSVMPDQAAVQNDSPNAGQGEEIPSCGQDANTGVFQSATCTKAEPLLQEPIHEVNKSSCQPSLGTKVDPAALPLEATSHDCINNGKLNVVAENINSTNLKDREQLHKKVGTIFPKKEQDRKMVKQREKRKKNDALPKEDKDQLAENAQKGHAEPKPLPSFKDFVVEEEEGSGGYGIVYRARRSTDGKVFAIKCPREKAHSHHVDNERKMLERFGGKSFVIRYEGCFRSGELDCFILEHVKHDRPEILKREINVFELQWYGYCLFKALSSLHKQGIVHRDVKPGNFLFSRDQTKGYLVDFNLASVSDVHHKFLKSSKSETMSCGKDTASQSSLKSSLVIHAKEAATDSKQPLGPKRKRSNKIPVGSDPRVDNKSRHGSQPADGSGVTSAKDPTSVKTPLDRLKQPMPYRGRKELMSFLQEAMDSPKQNIPAAPVSHRKRVAAPVGSVDRKLFVLTPMPLRCDGNAVPGSGTINSKGNGKQRREGPCVGTKGFRAPEVLLRSSHQSCKVDVWSAGVTLLYFIIGKAPFGGDPEQNMKEIAKIRGNEELWEVAKLHNCESSYPQELFDVKLLQSVDLREWCMANARRPELLEQVPDSLFDLVDKCLAVNPRCRITSEDALSHEFLAPCRESLKKNALRIRSASASHPPPCLPRDAMVNANEL
ncbi:probable serine/threonine-protein kinase cdc7 isoform X1 [Triticum dicoccoides]|uniref:probable serine/threonine-protein kinase cdc7 isoform X1 n=1 Tax=Triticum dicoccoides TaxID=85692 RepID=UPI0018906DB8|nr:probable serine/threonine-protein kinase cdc7 isoform X1 [Triticum dicoccoides]